jgi:hypothetical protein
MRRPVTGSRGRGTVSLKAPELPVWTVDIAVPQRTPANCNYNCNHF